MRNLYHKIRFLLKVLFFFPKTLLVGNTSNKLLVHNWPTSMDIFNGSTIITDQKMFYEPKEYEQFVRIAKDKKVFFDVGSHIGWYCLVANGLGIESSYAFEIVDSFADIAEKNFKLNNVKGGVFRVALGIPGIKIMNLNNQFIKEIKQQYPWMIFVKLITYSQILLKWI